MRCVGWSSLLVCAVAGCGPMLSSSRPGESGAASSGRLSGGVPYFLPKAVTKVTLSDLDGELQVTIGAPRYFADEAHPYLLQYRPSAFASDTFLVDVDPATGLLTKIDMKAEDKLDDIVIEIARAATIFAEGAADSSVGTVLVADDIDPANQAEVEALEVEMNNRARANAQLRGPAACKTKTDDVCTRYTAVLERRITINLDFQAPIPYANTSADCTIGACFRVPMPFTLGVDFGSAASAYRERVALPNGMPAVALDLDRVSFVTKTAVIDFKDGLVDSIKVEKPSQGLELVSLPLKIVGAVFDTLGKLIQFKIDTSGKEAALATQRAATIDAEEKLRQKQIQYDQQEAAAESRPLLVAASGGRGQSPPIGNITNTQQGAQDGTTAPTTGLSSSGSSGTLGN